MQDLMKKTLPPESISQTSEKVQVEVIEPEIQAAVRY